MSEKQTQGDGTPQVFAISGGEYDPEAVPPAYNYQTGNYGGTGTEGNVPPPYSSAPDPSGAPPSYESVFGKVKSAKEESSGCVDFTKKFLTILLGTVGCTITVALILAIPISMIVMGSVYLHDCPRERFIPIYLIVGGVFGVVKNISSIGHRVKNKKDGEEEKNAKTNPFDGILNCFLFAWFIAGNVWVYRSRDFQSNPTIPYSGPGASNMTTEAIMIQNPMYCDPTLYWYSFWLITASYIFVGLMCCCICTCGFCACMMADKGKEGGTQ